ncbi:MAG: glycoside hydrolase family 127 protein, partial [candidate division WOR-3 bacterium]
FFYPNCLESDGKYKFNQGSLTRKAWFDCSCCPTNVMRFIPSVPGYIYAYRGDSLYVNLFVASEASLDIAGTGLAISQETEYPWEGKIKINVNPKKDKVFTINIRIPGWASEKVVPSDLYRYLEKNAPEITLKVNGELLDYNINKGFTVITRKWSKGDIIELDLPMPVRKVLANEKVKDDRDKIALVRGPIVYCAEGADNDMEVPKLNIPDNAELKSEYRQDLLNGLVVIEGKVSSKSGEEKELTAIPYYAWSHRGPGEMAVWLRRK